ncbi:MAG: phage tail protein [Mesorhizobium sp.]|nr:phage tail protein [Mesorhizobium sp.]MBN9243853.1 phage tail protein [Mesorhizobium sp.]
MVKTPKTRHSRPQQQPMTIELGPDDVSRMADEPSKPEPEASAEPEPEAVADSGEAASRAEKSGTEDPGATTAEAPHRAFGYGFDEPPAGNEANARQAADSDAAAKAGERNDARREASPPPADGGAGLGGRIGAGVIGGVVALLGAGALQYAGLLGAPGGVTSDFAGQIADLKGQISAMKNGGDNGTGTRIDGLSAALDQVKADVVTLKAAMAPAQGGDDGELAALSDKVAEIEKSVAALGRGGNAQPVDLGPVNEKLGALEAELKVAGDAAGEQQAKLTALEQSVSQLSAKVEAQASQPKIALAIAAAALKSALDRGAPFAAELDTFAAIAPDAPQLAALRSYAEKGVPTRAAITGEVGAAANAMVAAAKPADPNAGIVQRLLSSAESLVEVRPIGAVEGKGVPETVARLEVAVNQGDYAKALAEYDTLPETAKAAGAGFAAELKARLDVEAQLDALISGAMKDKT